jgi:glutamate---cysteine ligase / carboxylate-amine ligase
VSPSGEDFTLGVEEEYQIVDPKTRELRAASRDIVPTAQASVGEDVKPELYQSQIEIGTAVCKTLEEVRSELVRLRREVAAAAAAKDCVAAAAGTHPFSPWSDQELTPKERYRGIEEGYQQLAREQIIFGCHVHVGIGDREAAVQTMNRCRPWLAPLIALAASSPFWLGRDSGYASFGREMWRRWPLAGIPPAFSSRAEYDDLIDALVATKAIPDATKIYWDIRPSSRFETIEFRVTDVCSTVDEAVMVAGLIRALARMGLARVREGEPEPDVPHALLVAANWRASRYGLEEELVDPLSCRAVPALDVVAMFMEYLRPALEQEGEWDAVSGAVNRTLERGTGAARQREAYAASRRFEDVVDLIVDETYRGVPMDRSQTY